METTNQEQITGQQLYQKVIAYIFIWNIYKRKYISNSNIDLHLLNQDLHCSNIPHSLHPDVLFFSVIAPVQNKKPQSKYEQWSNNNYVNID